MTVTDNNSGNLVVMMQEPAKSSSIVPKKRCCERSREKRDALRHGVRLLNEQIKMLEADKDHLVKALQEERARVHAEIEEKAKESAVRVCLETEILNLKSTISALQESYTSRVRDEDGELTLLRTCVSEREAEINCLNELLEKERKSEYSDEKMAEALNEERARVQAVIEAKDKETGIRVGLEKEIWSLKSEISALQESCSSKADNENGEVTLLQTRVSEIEAEINRLNELLENVKKRVDSDEKMAVALKEERARVQAVIEAKDKETVIRVGLEKEIWNLKSEISALQESCSSKADNENGEVTLLQTRVSESEAEINRLNELLEKVKKRVESDEKMDVALKEERARVQAVIEAKDKETAIRVGLEKEIWNLKSEISALQESCSSKADNENGEVALLRTRVSESEAEINHLNELLEKVKKREDSDEKMAEALNEERARVQAVIEVKDKETAIRVGLEKEIWNLKSEISALQESCSSMADNENGEVALLRTRVSESEAEINRLNVLLEKERKRRDSERKKVKAAKKQAAEAFELRKSEKREAEEVKKLADIERSQAEEYKLSVEALKNEVTEANAKLVLEMSKSEDARRRLEAEKQKANKEKKHADSATAKIQELRKCAEEEKKNAMNEKQHSDCVSKKLEEETRRNADLQKEIRQIKSAREIEKLRAFHSEEAYKSLEAEKQRVLDEKYRSDSLSEQLKEARQMIEKLQKEIQEVLPSRKMKMIYSNEAHRRLEVQAEELKKCVEEERNMAMKEKYRSACLFEQLGEERRRNEGLHKEINSVRQIGKVHPVHYDSITKESHANMVLLEKRLKLEKRHVKHAKNMAELEKMRNDLLQQEICRLKQDFLQFSGRLNLLDGCFPHSIEGIDDLAKIHSSSKWQESNLKGKFSGSEPCEMHCQSESDFVKTHYTTMEGFRHFRSRPASTVPLSGGSIMKSIPGICSELNSVIGGSGRSKSQNSAIYSTTASFSDRPLVGSQGRDAFSVSTSAKLPEENIPCLSNEKMETRYNKNLAVVAENNIGSPVSRDMDIACLNSNRDDLIKVAGRQPCHTKKKKRSREAVECIQYLYDDKKLLKQMDEKLSALHMLILKNNLSTTMDSIASKDGKSPDSSLLDGLNDKSYRSKKRRKVHQNQDHFFEPDSNADGHKQTGNETIEYAEVGTRAVPTYNHILEHVHVSINEAVDAANSNQNPAAYFENVANGDWMKLLELENAADEERYKIAMEMPLSPTLPEIDLPVFEASDGSKFMIEENFYKGLESYKDDLLPVCIFNVGDVDVDIDSNKSISNSSGTSCDSLPHVIVSSDNSFEELQNNNDGFHIALDAGKTCAHQVLQSTTDMVVAKQISVPGIELEVSCASDGGSIHERFHKCCVVFSNMMDNSSISRIICAREIYMSQISMASQTDWVVDKILLALAVEQNLLPEEKACVFFSLLLYNFALVTSVTFKNYLAGEISVCCESFVAHIITVMSGVETKRMFLELCHLDTLLSLIEDFLVNRRLLCYNEVSSELLTSCDSRSITLHVNGRTVSVSSGTATIDQLAAGSITLASICAAIDHIGYLFEASYNIIWRHISDSCYILMVVHVFASICGNKYFSLSNYSLIVTVIKSMVLVLERGNDMVGTICESKLPSASENPSRLPQCVKCIFADGALSIDKVIQLLLEKLQGCTIPGVGCESKMESDTSSNCSVPTDMERDEQTYEHEVGLCDLDMDFDASLYKGGRLAAHESTSVINRTVYHFSDILSLVELVARLMGWKWTYNKTVPHLLKMLESCASEKFSAAILILLGQMGRLGIDDSGYEQKGVEELRCSLSSFLEQNSTRKWSLPTQFATVHSLIGLLSLDFEEVIMRKEEFTVGTNGSGHHTNLVKKWFSQLNEERKSLAFRLFKSAGFHEI